MKAMPGDRIVLAPPTVDGATRDGEVLEVRGPDGEPPYLVRWSDGHEGLFYPAAGAVLSVDHAEGTRTTPAQPPPVDAGLGSGEHVRDWTVRISLFEDADHTAAHAVLVADSPEQLSARGHSHRNPRDPVVPEIGDEVAVARALRHLADRLLATAEVDIQAVTGEQAHLSAR